MNTRCHPLQIWLLWATLLPAAVQAQFIYTTNNGAITITYYTGSDAVAVLPGTIDGLPVTSIGSGAFEYSTSLTNVTIPASITNIGLYAFLNCYRLTGIYFQGNAPSLGLGGYAFDNRATIYYLPGTSGWSSLLGGRPTVMLTPPNPAGSLKVTLSPAAAITAGLQWQVDGGVAQPSGATALGLSVGNHVVSFSSADGWLIPPSQNVAVSANSTATAGATYGQLTYTTNNGAITIVYCPDSSSVAVIPGTINDLPVTSIGSGAFEYNTSLTSLTIPAGVTNIGLDAFLNCYRLTGIYFQGNAPSLGFGGYAFDNRATIYHLPGTSGWSSLLGGRPTALWRPQVQTNSVGFGGLSNQFGFNITWASDQVVVVEACTDLANPTWIPVATNTVTGSSSWFSDPGWTNYPGRFYRLRSQ
jgi:BspA type Leucine rich repeat region (6 copies)